MRQSVLSVGIAGAKLRKDACACLLVRGSRRTNQTSDLLSSSFKESCGVGVGGFGEYVPRRVAIPALSFWRDEGLCWDFPVFMEFLMWALLWAQSCRVSGTGEASPCVSCHYYIISGRVCLCLNDTVEAIWL